MSVRDLKLGQLALAHTANDLKLSVAASATFSLPLNLSSLEENELREAVVSGSIWITRGRACLVSIRVSFNGRALDERSRLEVLESLGYQCRDAHLWTQLSLSPCLDIPHYDSESSSSLCLFLKYATSSTSIKSLFRGWPLDGVDVKPPEALSVSILQQLAIDLDFSTQPRSQQSQAKRWKQNVELPDTLPSPSLISRLQPSVKIDPLAEVDVSHQVSNKVVPPDPDKYPRRGANGRFSSLVVAILERWFLKHANHPWPTNEQKLELMKQTGLKRDQINRWMGGHRKKRRDAVKATQRNKHDDILLMHDINENSDDNNELLLPSPGDQTVEIEELLLSLNPQHSELEPDTMLLQSDYDFADEEKVIWKSSSSIPSLAFGTSIPSKPLTSFVPKKHQLVTTPSETFQAVTNLDLTFAGPLTSAAFMVLISGQRRTQGIKIETPLPFRNLASIIPAMFCPGFVELMSHNSKFLPTIYNAALSWTRNAQGMCLKKKLQAVSHAEALLGAFQSRRSTLEGTISHVFQIRIWRMMQRVLNDSSMVRTLVWEKPKNEQIDVNEQSDNHDFLGKPHANMKVTSDFESLLDNEFMDEDEEELFEMLLCENESGSDDGLLGYLDEIERQSIEKETEEMLFCSQGTYDEPGSNLCGLDDVSERSDSMLI